MKLHKPFQITSRLLPGLRVGDGLLSLECVGYQGNKPAYRWYADIPAGDFSEADLAGHGSLQGMFGSLLAFLTAAAESYSWGLRTGKPGENADLFPPEVVEWAYQNQNELEAARFEIEETGAVLIEA